MTISVRMLRLCAVAAFVSVTGHTYPVVDGQVDSAEAGQPVRLNHDEPEVGAEDMDSAPLPLSEKKAIEEYEVVDTRSGHRSRRGGGRRRQRLSTEVVYGRHPRTLSHSTAILLVATTALISWMLLTLLFRLKRRPLPEPPAEPQLAVTQEAAEVTQEDTEATRKAAKATRKAAKATRKAAKARQKAVRVAEKDTEATKEAAQATKESAQVALDAAEATQKAARARKEAAQVAQKDTEATQKAAEVAQKDTEATQKAAEVTQKAAEVTQKDTEATVKAAEVTQNAAEVTQKAAEATPKAAEVGQNDTKATPKAAEVTQKVAKPPEAPEAEPQQQRISSLLKTLALHWRGIALAAMLAVMPLVMPLAMDVMIHSMDVAMSAMQSMDVAMQSIDLSDPESFGTVIQALGNLLEAYALELGLTALGIAITAIGIKKWKLKKLGEMDWDTTAAVLVDLTPTQDRKSLKLRVGQALQLLAGAEEQALERRNGLNRVHPHQLRDYRIGSYATALWMAAASRVGRLSLPVLQREMRRTVHLSEVLRKLAAVESVPDTDDIILAKYKVNWRKNIVLPKTNKKDLQDLIRLASKVYVTLQK